MIVLTAQQPSPLRRDSGVSSTSITLSSSHSPMSPAEGSMAYSQFAPSTSPKKGDNLLET